MKVLVTGAAGLVGQELISTLEAAGHQVVCMVDDNGGVVNQVNFDALNGAEIDHVFHLAARTFVPASWDDPKGFFEVIVQGTVNVLEFCRKHGIRMTNVASYLYGQPEYLPIDEKHVIKSVNPYMHMKHTAENMCRFYAENFDVNVVSIRPFNIFGKGQDDRFLIPHIINQVLQGDTIKVKDLNPKRDYVYIKDVVRALISSMSAATGFHVYNVGMGTSYSVKELIDMVQEVAGTDLPIESEDVVRMNEVNDVVANCSKIENELDWKLAYSFKEGIADILKG